MPTYSIQNCQKITIKAVGDNQTQYTKNAGANTFVFNSSRGLNSLTYVTSSATNGTTIDMPSGSQVGDIAFLFSSTLPAGGITGGPDASWQLISSGGFAGIPTAGSYFKVLTTPESLSGTIQGISGLLNSHPTNHIGIFRPNISICNLGINSNTSATSPPSYTNKQLALTELKKPILAVIQYSAASPMTTANIYASVTMDELVNPPALPGSLFRQYVRYKIYDAADIIENIDCNMGSNSVMNYFSVTMS